MELGQVIAMSSDQIVHHALDGVDVQFCCGMRIQHCSLVNVIQLLGMSSFDGQQLHVDVGHVHCCTLYGQSTHAAGIDTHAIDQTGNLNTGICRQVGDQVAGIQHVAADLVGSIGDDAFHDPGSIFVRTGMLLHTALLQLCVFLLPAFDLVDAAAGILIQRNVVALDQLRIIALDVECIVLRIVLTGLGAVVAEMLDVIQANLVLELGICQLCIDLGLVCARL